MGRSESLCREAKRGLAGRHCQAGVGNDRELCFALSDFTPDSGFALVGGGAKQCLAGRIPK